MATRRGKRIRGSKPSKARALDRSFREYYRDLNNKLWSGEMVMVDVNTGTEFPGVWFFSKSQGEI